MGRSIENNGLVYIHGLNGKIEFSNQVVDKWIKTQKGKIDFIWFLTTGGKELPVSRDKNGKFSFPDNDYFPYVSVVSGTLSLEKKQK